MGKKFGLGKGLGALIPEEIENNEVIKDDKNNIKIFLKKSSSS